MPNFLAFWQTFEWKQAVISLGVLDEEQKRDFFAGIDIFALPSRSDSFGLVLLEAWANGCPNLAYRAGGIAEIIHHESDGLLAACGNIDQLSTGLMRLVSDASLRQRLGTQGKTRVLTEFDWPSKLELVRRVYEEAIEKTKSRE